jgi:hypothetical protein
MHSPPIPAPKIKQKNKEHLLVLSLLSYFCYEYCILHKPCTLKRLGSRPEQQYWWYQVDITCDQSAIGIPHNAPLDIHCFADLWVFTGNLELPTDSACRIPLVKRLAVYACVSGTIHSCYSTSLVRSLSSGQLVKCASQLHFSFFL